MNRTFHIAPTADDLVAKLTAEFIEWIRSAESIRTVSLSGGSTPALLFERLATDPAAVDLPWQHVQLFWGDERCVPPDHPDSNYGMTKRLWLDHIPIPECNIHRIHGENDPEEEINRYASEIDTFVSKNADTYPRFDWTILGIGTDGHTASLFPGDQPVSESKNYCIVATQPQSKQKRISMTLDIINASARVSFLVTGSSKSRIVRDVFTRDMRFPASLVQPRSGRIDWFLDSAAAALI